MNILITGASSGIGKATKEYLTREGYKVYGGGRDYLDILDDNQIAKVMKEIGRLDVLINNAGYCLVGNLKDCSMEDIRKQFDTNFFAQISVIKHALPRMNKGRIINISSVWGRVGMPNHSIYSATKFSLEAITDALRIELPDIQVTTIQPAGIKTNSFLGNSDPIIVAKKIHKAITDKRMKRCYPVGRGSRILYLLKTILPAKIYENIIHKRD